MLLGDFMARYYLIAETSNGKKIIPLKYHDVMYNKASLELIDYLTSQYANIDALSRDMIASFPHLGNPEKIYIEYYVNKEAKKQKLIFCNKIIKHTSLDVFNKKKNKEPDASKVDLVDEKLAIVNELLDGIKYGEDTLKKQN